MAKFRPTIEIITSEQLMNLSQLLTSISKMMKGMVAMMFLIVFTLIFIICVIIYLHSSELSKINNKYIANKNHEITIIKETPE